MPVDTLSIPMMHAAARYRGMGGFWDFGFSGPVELPSTEGWNPDLAPWIFDPLSILAPDILTIYNAEPVPNYGTVPGYCPGGTYHDANNPGKCTPYPTRANASSNKPPQSPSRANSPTSRGTGAEPATTPGKAPKSFSDQLQQSLKKVPAWVYVAGGAGLLLLIVAKRRRR